MGDVRCTGTRCKGALHLPPCEKYLAAMQVFQAERDARRGERDRSKDTRKKHDKLRPDQLLTPEEAGARRKAGGGGRPLGSRNALPMGSVKLLQSGVIQDLKDISEGNVPRSLLKKKRPTETPLEYADRMRPAEIEALAVRGFRVRQGEPDEVRVMAGHALTSIYDVMMGRRGIKKASTVLRAAERIRDECCDPIVSEAKVNANVSMSAVVLAAQRALEEKRAAKRALTEGDGG